MGRNNMFKRGDSVLVGEPMADDLHEHQFTGTAVDISGSIVTVEDQDGDCFDVDAANCVIGE